MGAGGRALGRAAAGRGRPAGAGARRRAGQVPADAPRASACVGPERVALLRAPVSAAPCGREPASTGARAPCVPPRSSCAPALQQLAAQAAGLCARCQGRP